MKTGETLQTTLIALRGPYFVDHHARPMDVTKYFGKEVKEKNLL